MRDISVLTWRRPILEWIARSLATAEDFRGCAFLNDDPDRLATHLSLLVDGAYAAALIRKDPQAMQSGIAAARTLLKAAGVQLSAEGATELKAN